MYDKEGGQYGAYTLVSKKELKSQNGTGYVFYHTRTRARVAVISNDDSNKVFTIGFRTPPSDNTGMPHITEHSTLEGSRKYPVKDPFVELAKGSLNTFLNAMTYPDKTVYPVASVNDQDFANIMDVYLDAVFNPLIYERPQILKQEGWHYECAGENAPVIYNGVVYNEMKGAFSSPDSVLESLSLRSLYPETPYSFESGGDPEYIPDLTEEAFLDFHRRYYHPSNSYIYLYGDMDVQERLDYIDREYLSRYDFRDVDSEINVKKPFDEMKVTEDYYAISEGEDEQEKTYLSLNWNLGELDVETSIAVNLVDYMLNIAPGAPVKKALIDAGIGKDVYSGLETSIRENMYSITAQNADVQDKDRFLSVLYDTLNRVAEEGFDRRAMEAAINLMEFQNREADFGLYPKGLMYGLRMFDSWLYDDRAVFDSIDVADIYESLKEKTGTSYFTDILKKYIIDNHDQSYVVMKPKKGLEAERNEKTARKLQAFRDSLSHDELMKLIDDTRKLKEYQDTPDDPETLKCIPLLKVSDIKKETVKLSNVEQNISGIKTVSHDTFTNGIAYVELRFDMRNLPLKLVPVASLMVDLLKEVNTEHHTYQQLDTEINLSTGGVGVSDGTYGIMDEDDFGSYFAIRTKALYENVPKAVDLLREILLTSDLSDTGRIRDIVNEVCVSTRASLISQGNASMANRASAQISASARYREYTDYMDYYDALCDWRDHFDEMKDELVQDLETVARDLFTRDNVTASVTADTDTEKLLKVPFEKLYEAMPEKVELERPEIELLKGSEAFKTSAQVQYCAQAGDFLKGTGYSYTGALNVLKVIFSYDYLWINVRVKGGAYGCGAAFNRSGVSTLTSYRDPNLSATFDVFEKAADYVENFSADERTMTGYIIGTMSLVDRPMTADIFGSTSFAAYLSHISEADRQKSRDEILGCTAQDIRNLAPLVRKISESKARAVIGNEDRIEENRDTFDRITVLK